MLEDKEIKQRGVIYLLEFVEHPKALQFFGTQLEKMYVTLAERLRAKTNPWRPVDASANEDDKNRQVFRGFVGGAAFMTKKGYRGLAVDTSWSKNIIFSFDQDDVDITIHALKSCLADLSETVIGGTGGAPYSIGDYGFFTEEQFTEQAELLKNVDRANAERRQIFFSEPEWGEIDKKINIVSEYGKAIFSKVARGDNFGILALRRDAFQVAKFLLERGIDPLRENEAGQDMFVASREAYLSLTLRLKMIVPRQEEYLASVRIRTALEKLNQDTIYLGERFAALKTFALALQERFQARIQNIQNDMHYQKRCELLNEACPEDKLWNIAQLEKVQKHSEDIVTLIEFAKQKADHAMQLQTDFTLRLQQPRIRAGTDEGMFSSPGPSQRGGGVVFSPSPSKRTSQSNVGTPVGYSTPTRNVPNSVVSLPPIVTSPSPVANRMLAVAMSEAGRSTPTRYNTKAQYAPILGALSQSENEVTLYR